MNVGILWDIENVTPPSGTNYIQAVLDTVSKDGRISYAMAFGDWSKANIKNIAYELSINNFELIHIPHNEKKNSADMSLVANGVELLFKYPHIERYILISGDGDFRPLLLSLKKYGKETWVICDINKNASEDLVRMADNTLDYREIIKQIDEFIDIAGENDDQSINELTKEKAFELFKETVGLIIKENKKALSTTVKTKMKLLNNQFDEKELGYQTWREFVEDAKKATNIIFLDHYFIMNNSEDNIIPEIFGQLIEKLPENNEWVLFQKIAQTINFKGSGYNKFKDMALDAEKRGYVEIKNKNLDWSMKRKL